MIKRIAAILLGCLALTSCVLDVDSIVPYYTLIEDYGFGGEVTFSVYATGPWTCGISTNMEGLTVTPNSGEGSANVTVKIPENTTKLSDISYLSFKCGDAQTSVAVYHYVPSMATEYENYYVVKLKDGNWWSASNFYTVSNSQGISPKDFSTNTGVWYPCNAETGSADMSMDGIMGKGYMYSAEKVAKSCPEGWHVPSKSEWEDLIGLYTYAELNEAGFNLAPIGVVSEAKEYSGVGQMAKFACAFNEGADVQDAMVFSDGVLSMGTYGNNDGISIRCVMDEETEEKN